MSRYHDIWVLTRANNRRAVERALGNRRLSGLEFVYYDLPAWSRFWKRGSRGVQFYYYLWQLGTYFVARKLHHQIGFDLTHHVTLAKYWMPSLLALLPVPFVFGPVGGAESAPLPFWADFSVRGKAYEALRTAGRWLGEHDPLVHLAVRRSAVALAKTEETARRLRRLGAKDVRVVPGEGLTTAEIERLAEQAPSTGAGVRFVGIGNLLHLKGFHLGLRAFAQAGLKDAEYWIIGEGPERRALEALAREMGIGGQVRFWGWLSRNEALRKLAESHVLVHPSLHDSGGWVCAEAMAVGRPVLCLDLGGPSTQVTDQTGFRVRPDNPRQAVRDLAEDMQCLAVNATLRRIMGEAGRSRSMDVFSWEAKGERLNAIYRHAVSKGLESLGALSMDGRAH
jgi:glycosyltransferase involved in cell wall biosynthesis